MVKLFPLIVTIISVSVAPSTATTAHTCSTAEQLFLASDCKAKAGDSTVASAYVLQSTTAATKFYKSATCAIVKLKFRSSGCCSAGTTVCSNDAVAPLLTWQGVLARCPVDHSCAVGQTLPCPTGQISALGEATCSPAPTAAPTKTPTAAPTETPTAAPTDAPTAAPTDAPTGAPTETPTAAPTDAPTAAPTETPTAAPTETPTAAPTETPTAAPTETPTAAPTDAPTAAPTDAPTAAPTDAPTAAPTASPTASPVASGNACDLNAFGWQASTWPSHGKPLPSSLGYTPISGTDGCPNNCASHRSDTHIAMCMGYYTTRGGINKDNAVCCTRAAPSGHHMCRTAPGVSGTCYLDGAYNACPAGSICSSNSQHYCYRHDADLSNLPHNPVYEFGLPEYCGANSSGGGRRL